MTRAAPRRAEARRQRGNPAFRVGIVVLVLALAALAWSVWDVLVRPPVDADAAARAVADLRGQWSLGVDPLADPGALEAGDPVAIVQIPALGGTELPLLVGTDDDTLARGLGWYDGTAAPGAIGNLGMTGLGELRGPLANLVTLAEGDAVLVETRDATYTYALTNEPGETTVADTDTWVIQPVPGQPEVAPSEALLTITTDGGLLRAGERTVAWATLVDTTEK